MTTHSPELPHRSQAAPPLDHSLLEASPPCGSRLLLIALIAMALRAVIAIASPHFNHDPSLPHFAHLWDYAYWGDGPSYVAQAKAMCGDSRGLTDFDRRVFPGFPALIAAAHVVFRVPFAQAALLIPWICSGIAAAAAAFFFREKRLGWAMAVLIPHYLSYSSMPMSEAPLLAFILTGMILARGQNLSGQVIGGLLFGIAGMIRPVACFAVLGMFVFDLYRGRTRPAFITAITAALAVAAGIGAMHWWTGDALHGVHVYAHDKAAYDGELFTWPFHSLLSTPSRPDLPFLKKGKILYIWIHVALVLVACTILARRLMLRSRTPSATASTHTALDALCLPWLLGNTLFVLCVGSKWGFLAFPRFTVPALPATFWAYRSLLPKRGWIWIPIAAVSVLIALDSVKRMN